MMTLFDLIKTKRKENENIYVYYSNNDKDKIFLKDFFRNCNRRTNLLISDVEKSNLSSLKKEFLKNQILNNQNGVGLIDDSKSNIGFSFKDLFILIEKKINYILQNKSMFNGFYPIITSNIPTIDEIAMFIACLKLNLHPLVFDIAKVDIESIKVENKFNDGFYILSSGSTGRPSVKELSEKTFISKQHVERNLRLCIGDFQCESPLYGISGLVLIFINTLFANNKVYFDDFSYLRNILTDDASIDVLSKPENQFIIGKYISPNKIPLKNISQNLKFSSKHTYYGYGQTENYGIVTLNNITDAKQKKINIACFFKKISKIKSLKIFEGNLLKLIKCNLNLKKIIDYDVEFFSVGKIDSNIWISGNKKYGEIVVDGINTGDIGLIEDGYLYVLCRKNDIQLSLFKNFIKYRYNLDITFSNDNKFFVVDGFDFRDIDNVFKLKMEYPLIKKELNLNFDFIPYYEEFTRSPGLRKSISSNLDWLDIKKMSEEIKDDEILIKSLKIMIIKYIFDLNMKKIKNKSFDENELHILKLYKDLNIELYPFLWAFIYERNIVDYLLKHGEETITISQEEYAKMGEFFNSFNFGDNAYLDKNIAKVILEYKKIKNDENTNYSMEEEYEHKL